MNGGNTIDQFTHTARHFTRGDLAFTAKFNQAAAQFWNHNRLHGNDTASNEPQPKALQHDKAHCGQRLATEQNRGYKGITNKAANRFDLIFDHTGHF